MALSEDRPAGLIDGKEDALSRVVIDLPVGQIAAALADDGRWVIQIRKRADEAWRLACHGNLSHLTVVAGLPRAPRRGIRVAGMTIRPDSRSVMFDGAKVDLARKEFDFLLYLAADPHRIIRGEELMQAIWGFEPAAGRGSVSQTASKVRRKLAAAGVEGDLCINHWGIGYSLLEEGDSRGVQIAEGEPPV